VWGLGPGSRAWGLGLGSGSELEPRSGSGRVLPQELRVAIQEEGGIGKLLNLLMSQDEAIKRSG
jgi:hypothetical protein